MKASSDIILLTAAIDPYEPIYPSIAAIIANGGKGFFSRRSCVE